MLYLGIGDSSCFECPQSLDNLHGKIIRIDVRGATAEEPYQIPVDNPLLNTPDARPEIWAYGLRNPWRMAFDPQTGRLWIGDVGQDIEEEVSVAFAGANLGWPIYEDQVASSLRMRLNITTAFPRVIHVPNPTVRPCRLSRMNTRARTAL